MADLCGHYMRRAGEPCANKADHKGQHNRASSLAKNKPHKHDGRFRALYGGYPTDLRTCINCLQAKALSAFSTHGGAPNNPLWYCICEECRVPLRTRNVRSNRLRREFGISLTEFERMFAAQGKRCAICRTDTDLSQKMWHTDHDHATGKVRGILCHNCNTGLGMFRDNTASLFRAADYLLCVGEEIPGQLALF